MSRTLSTLQAALLGLCFLAGLGLIGYAVWTVGARKLYGRRPLEVVVSFDNIQGVETGTPVRVRGMEVGEVVEVQPPETADDKVLLRLRIREKYKHLVRKGAPVQIVSIGMLGGKALEIQPGNRNAPLAANDDALTPQPSTDLMSVVEKTQTALQDVLAGEGTIGQLVRNPEMYHETVKALKAMQGAGLKVQEDADALKAILKNLPYFGKYVIDDRGLLDRGAGEFNRKEFPEAKLFPPERAVLSSRGETELNDLEDWLAGLLSHPGAELIVLAYAASGSNPDDARKWTQDQSKTVLDHLNARFNRRFKFFEWRKSAAVGMGVQPAPRRLQSRLPAPRIEILVFVPQTN